ncbi:MAG: Calx-beta domain-containing protein [Pseudomonadota bacterium]
MTRLAQMTTYWSLIAFISLSLIGCTGSGSDAETLPSISVNDASATDLATEISTTILLSKASTEIVTVKYQTLDGTALAGVDYTTNSGEIAFAPGVLTATVSIALIATRDTTDTKMFHFALNTPTNAIISDDTAILTLTNPTDSALFSNPPYTPIWGNIGVFTTPETCKACHTGTATIMNYNGKDISPSTSRVHTTMAHALNDPYFNAVVEEETHVFPDKKVFIEDTCLRCHSPMAYTHAHSNPTLLTPDPSGILADGGYPMADAMNDPHARDGISCTACHQIKDVNLGDITSMSGHFTLNSEADRDSNGKLAIHGPFYPVGQAMQNITQYQPTFSTHIKESGLCASCHNLYTPTLDLDGNLAMITNHVGVQENAQFPEQTPYWEWLNSSFSNETTGKSCQGCHMSEPAPDYATQITTFPTNAPLRTPFSQHEMVGSNVYLLELLKKYSKTLGIDGSTTTAGFETKKIETHALLETASTVTIGTTIKTDNTLSVPVSITNHTGHKLPTSYPSRRLWLHTKVTDTGSNTVIFESGAFDENGRIAKDDAFTHDNCLKIEKEDVTFDYATCYEPHYDVISDASQVQIYEAILGDVNEDITHVLLHARKYKKDNRILPVGFTNAKRHLNPVDPTLYDDGIFGLAEDDADFTSGIAGIDAEGSDGTDTVTYEVPTTTAGPFTIEVALLYQTIKPSFVESLHADDPEHGIVGDSHVRRFKAMYQETPHIPARLATATATHP